MLTTHVVAVVAATVAGDIEGGRGAIVVVVAMGLVVGGVAITAVGAGRGATATTEALRAVVVVERRTDKGWPMIVGGVVAATALVEVVEAGTADGCGVMPRPTINATPDTTTTPAAVTNLIGTYPYRSPRTDD